LRLLKFCSFHVAVWASVWNSANWLAASDSGPFPFSKHSLKHVFLGMAPGIPPKKNRKEQRE